LAIKPALDEGLYHDFSFCCHTCPYTAMQHRLRALGLPMRTGCATIQRQRAAADGTWSRYATR